MTYLISSLQIQSTKFVHQTKFLFCSGVNYFNSKLNLRQLLKYHLHIRKTILISLLDKDDKQCVYLFTNIGSVFKKTTALCCNIFYIM